VAECSQGLLEPPTEVVGAAPHVQGVPQGGAEVVNTAADGHAV